MAYGSHMTKTTVYLTDDLASALARAAQRVGRPQAELIREALQSYLSALPQPKVLSIGLGSDAEVSAEHSEDWIRSRWSER